MDNKSLALCPPEAVLSSFVRGSYYGWPDDPNFSTPLPGPLPAAIVKFDLWRGVYASGWEKRGGDWYVSLPFRVDERSWSNDSYDDIGKIVVPTPSNHLYFTDAPGNEQKVRPQPPIAVDYSQHYYNFRNRVVVEIYGKYRMCSDFYRWHSQIFEKPKPNTNFWTRAKDEYQKLGQGWIEVPAGPDLDTNNW